jgi:histidine triad (HIT) family protein
MNDECLFCKIASKKINAKLVLDEPDFLAFEDIHPQAPVHILVIPRKHVASLNEAGGEDGALLGAMMLAARRLAREKGVDASGYRIVVNTLAGAGQSVFHIHLHLLGGRIFVWPPG